MQYAEFVDKGVAFAKDTITKALAAGQRPSEQMFVIPARALQEANRNDEMFDMLALRVQAYPNPQTWNQTLRLLLGTTSGNKAMSLDVFRQIGRASCRARGCQYV